MANKYHPDKVSHLGEKMQKIAEEKFKAVNDAYQQIKKITEHNMKREKPGQYPYARGLYKQMYKKDLDHAAIRWLYKFRGNK